MGGNLHRTFIAFCLFLVFFYLFLYHLIAIYMILYAVTLVWTLVELSVDILVFRTTVRKRRAVLFYNNTKSLKYLHSLIYIKNFRTECDQQTLIYGWYFLAASQNDLNIILKLENLIVKGCSNCLYVIIVLRQVAILTMTSCWNPREMVEQPTVTFSFTM